jgi:hypothetical protein
LYGGARVCRGRCSTPRWLPFVRRLNAGPLLRHSGVARSAGAPAGGARLRCGPSCGSFRGGTGVLSSLWWWCCALGAVLCGGSGNGGRLGVMWWLFAATALTRARAGGRPARCCTPAGPRGWPPAWRLSAWRHCMLLLRGCPGGECERCTAVGWPAAPPSHCPLLCVAGARVTHRVHQ